MKKIMYYNDDGDYIIEMDSTDYIIIEKDNQRISDKYVNLYGKKFSDSKALIKGDLIIRRLYIIVLEKFECGIYFNKFKYYMQYNHGKEHGCKVKKVLDTKNSVFNFDGVKHKIISIFSKEMKIYL